MAEVLTIYIVKSYSFFSGELLSRALLY